MQPEKSKMKMNREDDKDKAALDNTVKSQREISNFYGLIGRVELESPLLANAGLKMSISSKLKSLEIMQRYTIEKARRLFDVFLEDKADIKEKGYPKSIFNEDLNVNHCECIAFFEAYLNAFYSLLQVIAKVTPYFYDQKEKIPNYSFERQSTYFLKNESIDPEYAQYLKSNMKWFDDLVVCNRHAISHNASVFLGFGEDGIVFIHMPERRINYFESGKPSKKLIEHISNNWNSLFDFLNFYTKHFSNFQIIVNKEEELKELRDLISKNPQPL